jgi:hypothetical protein
LEDTNFYFLDTNASQVGAIPQAVTKVFYFRHAPNSLWSLEFTTSVDDLVLPEKLNLVKNALWTDLLVADIISLPYIVLSPRFWEKIQTMRLPPNAKGFPIQVERRGKQMLYYVVWLGYPMYHYIDFEKSTVVYGMYNSRELGGGLRESTVLAIKTADEFLTYLKSTLSSDDGSPKNVHCTNPILKKESIQHDIFFTGRGTGIAKYIVSQQFVDAMAEENLTGVKFLKFQ